MEQTGKAPLTFDGDEIASVYGRYLYGRRLSNYHNLIIYRATSGQYTVAVQYRADSLMDEPYDAVLPCKDWNALRGELSAHEGSVTHLRYAHLRFRTQAAQVLDAVRRLEEGLGAAPVRLPIMVDWRKLDSDVVEMIEEAASEEGITPQEWLRQSVVEEIAEDGGTGLEVIIEGTDGSTDDGPEACADCHESFEEYFTSQFGEPLCPSCFDARKEREGGL